MDPCSPCIWSLLVFSPGGGDRSSSPAAQPRCGAAADVARDIIDWQRPGEWERRLWEFEAGFYRLVNFLRLLERKSSFRRRVSESNRHLAGRATPISCQRSESPHSVCSSWQMLIFTVAFSEFHKSTSGKYSNVCPQADTCVWMNLLWHICASYIHHNKNCYSN